MSKVGMVIFVNNGRIKTQLIIQKSTVSDMSLALHLARKMVRELEGRLDETLRKGGLMEKKG